MTAAVSRSNAGIGVAAADPRFTWTLKGYADEHQGASQHSIKSFFKINTQSIESYSFAPTMRHKAPYFRIAVLVSS